MYRLMMIGGRKNEMEATKKMVNWEQLGIEVIGEVADGDAISEEVLRLKPEIVIVDTHMGNRPGLELVKRVQDSLPGAKTILISRSEDAKFISEAVNNGVCGYVLKPVQSGELVRTVSKTLAICREEKRSLALLEHKQRIEAGISSLQENFYRNLLYGVIQDEEDIRAQSRFLNVDTENRQYCVAYMELESEEGEKAFFHGVTITEKLKRNYRDVPGVHFILLDLVHIAVIFSDVREDAGSAKKQYLIRTREMLDFVNTTYSLLSTAGIGNVVLSLKDIGSSCREALKALQYKYHLGKMHVIDTEEVNFQYMEQELGLENLNEVVRQILFFGEKMLVEAFVNDMLPEDTSYPLLECICFTVMNVFRYQLLLLRLNPDDFLGPYPALTERIAAIKDLNSLKGWMIQTILLIIEYVRRSSKQETSELTAQMEDFVRSNYHRQILLQDVAEAVQTSPSHASYVFRNTFGKTIHQYIEELRMEKAVRLLLEDRDLRTFEIAEAAGYSNSSCFMNVFRKMYSCTPSEYRSKYLA